MECELNWRSTKKQRFSGEEKGVFEELALGAIQMQSCYCCLFVFEEKSFLVVFLIFYGLAIHNDDLDSLRRGRFGLLISAIQSALPWSPARDGERDGRRVEEASKQEEEGAY